MYYRPHPLPGVERGARHAGVMFHMPDGGLDARPGAEALSFFPALIGRVALFGAFRSQDPRGANLRKTNELSCPQNINELHGQPQ